LLGTRGLIRSYKTAADEAIKNATIIKKVITEKFNLQFDYGLMNDVMKILHEENIVPENKEFGAKCQFTIGIRKTKKEEIITKFEKLHELKVTKK
jgi:putative IMPACT (imprinted ancient) family translation regulator